MRTRQEIKLLAKSAIEQQQGTAILVFFLYNIIAGGASVFQLFSQDIGSLIQTAVAIFLVYPLSIGLNLCYIKIYRQQLTGIDDMFSSLLVNYLRKVGAMFLVGLFTFLWSLLFIIPGIIKALSYAMTPFILAEYPNVKARDAIKLSMRMTDGYKAELFVLYLSFIGWVLLSVFTCGFLLIFYVGPYMYATYAGFYVELRNRALQSGVISPDELGYDPWNTAYYQQPFGYPTQMPGYAPYPNQPGYAPYPNQPGYAPYPNQPGYAPDPNQPGYAPYPNQPGYTPYPNQPGYAPNPNQPGYAPNPDQPGFAPDPNQPGYTPHSEPGISPDPDQPGPNAGPVDENRS